MGDKTETWKNREVLGETVVTSGIRQECTGSPKTIMIMVNVISDNVLNSGMRCRDEEFCMPSLFFADNGLVVLIFQYRKYYAFILSHHTPHYL